MKRISRLPVWWQLFIGLACCFLLSLIVICASFFIDVKEAEKNNWFYLHKMNSQWEMEIETITKNLDYLKYLPLIDKTIMSNLRNDYEKQSLKKQLSYKEYVNGILEDISGINPFILHIPESGVNIPHIILIVVDFPAPLGPIYPNHFSFVYFKRYIV